MQNLLTHKKWILFFVILLVALGMATPVLADWLGVPNRKVTTTVATCHWVKYRCAQQKDGSWDYKSVDSWLCSNESKPWEGCSKNSPPCNSTNDGHTYCERQEGTKQETVTYPPATITGAINCTWHGEWCNGTTAPVLALSANEPLQGYSITQIEGQRNGVDFVCPQEATSCTLSLDEGQNDFAYWAHSTWPDTSDKGLTSVKVDTVAPSVGLDIQGTRGANNWWASVITVTPTGDDATSGVASRLLSIDDGATWQPSVTLNEGVYDLIVQVTDYAGNVSTSTTTLMVDTTTPTIDVSVSGMLGNNNYYKSVIQVAGDPKDATSGVATFEVAVDGAAYQAYTAPISFNDGQHTIRFRACDAAGNCTETPLQTFLVDTTPPSVNLPASWKLGTNIAYDVWDEGSCLAALRIVIEDEDEKFKKVAWDQHVSGCTFSQDIDWNGKFKDGTVAPPGAYLVWLKAKDLAGNEKFYLGKVIVPEPNLFLNLLPTEEPAASALPDPPAELFEPEAVLPVTSPPTTGFGGETTEPGEATKQSVILATGTAGAASATTTSGVLWGAMAAAAIGAASAYAFAATRKREEAEAAQAAQVKAEVARSKAGRAEKHMTKSEKAERAREHDEKVKERKERQSWANPAKEKARLEFQEQQALLAQQEEQARQAAYNARMEERMAKLDAQDDARWVSAQVKRDQAVSNAHMAKKIAQLDAQDEANWAAVQKKLEDKKMAQAAAKNAGILANLPGYFNSEKQAPAEKPWWEKAASFVQEKIIQPAAQSAFVRKVVLPVSLAALAVTGTANTYQWYQNVTQNSHLFDNVRQTMVEQLQTQAPSFFLDQDTKWQLLRSDPYAAVHDSVETLNIFLSGAANAIDTVWQQNPAVREIVKDMKIAADVACAQVESEAWQRRCIGLTYHTTAFVEHPADSLLGLGESVVIYPVEGLIKTGVFLAQYESVSLGRDLLHGWQEDGWQGLVSVNASHMVRFGQLVLTDPQVQSFAIATSILALIGLAALFSVPALVTTSVLGLVALAQTAWGALGIEQTIQQLPNLQSVKEYVASHQARTFTITSLFILALAALGVTKGVGDLQSFKGPLSPTAQESFASRSWWNQLQLVDAAKAAKASPGAINFYLEHSTVGDARLAGLPFAEALRVSSLADRSSQGTFLLDYVTRYGEDPAAMKVLLNTSPETVKLYVEQTALPDSLLNKFSPQQGLQIVNGKVVSIDPGLAQLLAKQLSKATGQNAWGSPTDGNIYLSTTSPRAITALQQLVEEGPLNPNRAALIRILGEESMRGTGDRLILGPYKESTGGVPITIDGVEQGLYIQQALNENGLFFDLGSNQIKIETNVGDMWTLLEKNDIDPFLVNESTLQIAVENKVPIDFKLVDVDAELAKFALRPDAEVPVRVREMRWLVENAEEYGYVKEGNSWLPTP